MQNHINLDFSIVRAFGPPIGISNIPQDVIKKLNQFVEPVLYKKTVWSLLLKTQKNLESGADFLNEKEEESNVREFTTQTLGTLAKKY